jgi:hypothetical protein
MAQAISSDCQINRSRSRVAGDIGDTEFVNGALK